MIKMTYKQIGSFEFSQAIAKIEHTPTSAQKAAHIRHISKFVKAGKDKIHDEYKTNIMDKFGKKGEDGKTITAEDRPGGFEMDDSQTEEFNKAFKEFEAREIEVDWRPLTPDTLSDIKLSAREIELLGPLFSEDQAQGPGIPNLQSIRG